MVRIHQVAACKIVWLQYDMLQRLDLHHNSDGTFAGIKQVSHTCAEALPCRRHMDSCRVRHAGLVAVA